VRGYLNILSYLAVPVLFVLAFRALLKSNDAALPIWRRIVGLASIIVISADWLYVPLWLVINKVDRRWDVYFDQVFDWFSLAAVVSALLAIALTGRARLCAAAAGFCMFVFWVTSWVY